MSGDGIKARFVSGLPAVTDLSGSRHHNPGAPAGSPSGPAENFTVVHLTGTTPGILDAAAGTHAASVPLVYSPMLDRAVAPGNRWSRGVISGIESGFEPGRRRGIEGMSLAGRIGAMATRVAVENEFMAGYLAEMAGIDRRKIVVVGMPPPGRATAASDGEERREGREANLLVALCDDLTPEWNVLHLIFALEKINADAVIFSERAAGAYADSCRERAELNPRVKLIVRSGGAADTDRETAAAIADALCRATIAVDPSAEGLCYPFIASAAAAGLPAVISRRSVCRISMPDEVELFEPSSWELLNHAVTAAFNRSASAEVQQGPARAQIRRETADRFENIYGDIIPS